VERKRQPKRLAAGRGGRERLERRGVVVVAKRRARFGEPLVARAEQRDRRRPDDAVGRLAAGARLRAELGAEGEELREVGHDRHVAVLGDPDETVRVEVVAEEDARVAVRGREEPRAAVVEEVALVDRLEAEREARLGERREDSDGLPVARLEERGGPEVALARRLVGDRLPDVRYESQSAASLAQ
jgi:hypothetical protein